MFNTYLYKVLSIGSKTNGDIGVIVPVTTRLINNISATHTIFCTYYIIMWKIICFITKIISFKVCGVKLLHQTQNGYLLSVKIQTTNVKELKRIFWKEPIYV